MGPTLAERVARPDKLALPEILSIGDQGATRDFVHEVIGDGNRTDVAALLTSELATNALNYAGSEFTVEIRVGTPLRIDVIDSSTALPALQPSSDQRPGGRGLLIVDALAAFVGHRAPPSGKSVWFEL